jgi:hypothetical protein
MLTCKAHYKVPHCMQPKTIALALFLSCIATTSMVYVSMALPIGPWIAPTLVLIALCICCSAQKKVNVQEVALAVSSGSLGGIIATAVGFYMPTLFFGDKHLFGAWLAQPYYFAALITAVTGVAGWLGLWCARVAEPYLIDEQQLAFPISHLVHGMIMAHAQVRRLYGLAVGFVSTFLICMMQDGLCGKMLLIPKTIMVSVSPRIGPFILPALRFDLWPMVWAIGFMAGERMVLPLMSGVVANMVLINPMHAYLFHTMSATDFILAFCTGMVLVSTVCGMMSVLRRVMNYRVPTKNDLYRMLSTVCMHKRSFTEGILLLCVLLTLGSFIGFSLLASLFIFVLTLFCSYQMMLIAGKIGVAPLGRFATMVMVPVMLVSTRDVWQLTLLSVFVATCGGVAVDALSGRVLARLCSVEQKSMERYQYGGVLMGALIVGCMFVLVVRHIPLGSVELFAHKAQTRALLLTFTQFDWSVVLVGACFGLAIQWCNGNTLFVLSGILMPLHLVLGLIFGGLLSLGVRHKEQYEPFVSGVFASNALWMVIRATLG